MSDARFEIRKIKTDDDRSEMLCIDHELKDEFQIQDYRGWQQKVAEWIEKQKKEKPCQSLPNS